MTGRRIRTDGSNPFARHTMTDRIPGILEDVRKRNPGLPEAALDALGSLAADIRGNGRIPAPVLPMPDYEYWLSEWRLRRDETWLDTEWFYAEHWVYRLLAGITGWWVTGLDPFRENKREEYAGARFAALLDEVEELIAGAGGSGGAPAGDTGETLSALLMANLWGNRADLSHAVSMAHGGNEEGQELLLADDRERVVRLLLSGDAMQGGRAARGSVQIVTDNAGPELAMDLVLSDLLLSADPGLTGVGTIILHTKLHPTYVSDATAADVLSCIEWIGRRGREPGRGGLAAALAERLAEAYRGGRLVVAPDPFWNSASFIGGTPDWGALPDRISAAFRSARLVVMKGDVNYRRLEGDFIVPQAELGASVAPALDAPVLVIRAIKSDSLSGVDALRARDLDAKDPGWRSTGRYGMIRLDEGDQT